MTLMVLGWFLLGLFCLSLIFGIGHGRAIQRSLESADSLSLKTTEVTATVDVIIPAFNEAANIEECVNAALRSMEGLSAQIWIADDQSTDETLAIAQKLAQQHHRVNVVQVPPRPSSQPWFGKNWACHVVSQQSQADYLLFIDADVLLQPDGLTAALQEAQESQAALLTVFPELICRNWAEWLVQPLIFGLIVGFCNFGEMNDPNFPDTVFGSGPFMLFRRNAYEQIDGHRGVAGDPVEDVALAKRVKQSSMCFRVMLSGDLVRVRMYSSFSSLFEGWTKNFHLGFGRSIRNSSLVALLMVVVWSIPQLSLLVAIAYLIVGWLNHYSLLILVQGGLMLGVSLLLQAVMFRTRSKLAIVFVDPLKYGLFTFGGGILVAAIAIASIIKTETGWGWTWRGRSLARFNAVSTHTLSD